MQIKDPNHPAWRLGFHAVYLLAALGSLWLFSTTFDETEMKALATIIAAVAATEGFRQFITRHGSDQ
jgi:hypothetical protein